MLIAGSRDPRVAFARLRAIALLLLLLPVPAAAQALPSLSIPTSSVLTEGDSGHTPNEFEWVLSAPSATPVSFRYSVRGGFFGDQPADYVDVENVLVVIPPGQTRGVFLVHAVGDRLVEIQEPDGELEITELTGAVFSGSQRRRLTIRDDDVRLPPPWIARDDQVTVPINYNEEYPNIDPWANDTYDINLGYVVEVLTQPAHGSVKRAGRSLNYIPDRDYHGEDFLRLRICIYLSFNCRESTVAIDVGPWIVQVSGASRSDRARVQTVLPPMATIHYAATALADRRWVTLMTGPDFTPETPWDNDDGVAWTSTVLPALPPGEEVEHRITVAFADSSEQGWSSANNYSDLYVGIDSNQDGRPSPGEVLCTDNSDHSTPSYTRCEVRITQRDQPVRWWVMVHSRDQAYDGRRVGIHDVAMVDADSDVFTVVGPGHTPGGTTALTVAWNDPAITNYSHLMGYAMLRSAPDAKMIAVPIGVSASSAEDPAIQLQPGLPRRIGLLGGNTHRRIWFDVPEGSTRLRVLAASTDEVDYYLVRQTDPLQPALSTIPMSPDISLASAVADGPGGDAELAVEGGVAPGRWYLVTANAGSDRADFEVAVELEALAPVVRPGSYFNAARPGSGLFLYPAGNQLTGLWYTYASDLQGSPTRGTWYWLQADAPGPDGVWNSRIWRGVWNGSSRSLRQVGRATVTPNGADSFLFSYTLEGRAGSQPMTALARGCGNVGGIPVDASGQWFDPARSGTGYSVQLWPSGYEYVAAYVYDSRGEPLFLAAERAGPMPATADSVVQRLTGACPTCSQQAGWPLREDVGTLRRTITSGVLERMQIDVELPDVPGGYDWIVDDRVQLLGLSQGCEP